MSFYLAENHANLHHTEKTQERKYNIIHNSSYGLKNLLSNSKILVPSEKSISIN
jgi:hypothetical protein